MKQLHYNQNTILVFLVAGCIFFGSCKKFVDVGLPESQLIGAAVFSSDATATAAQVAIYSQMENDGFAYTMMVNSGISSDECANYRTAPDAIAMASNNLTSENTIISALWNRLYKYIYQSNAVLEGLSGSNNLSRHVNDQLRGEALFTRSFFYYYLVNLFGNIPFIAGTDAAINARAEQKDPLQIYEILVSDLKEAYNLLVPYYVGSNFGVTSERIRPCKYAAFALLSRIYLHQQNWSAAEVTADTILMSGRCRLVNNLNNVFLKNSEEAIWQLQAVVPKFNAYAGGFLQATGTPSVISLAPVFINGFQTGDLRKSEWTKNFSSGNNQYAYPYKFKVGQNSSTITEYT